MTTTKRRSKRSKDIADDSSTTHIKEDDQRRKNSDVVQRSDNVNEVNRANGVSAGARKNASTASGTKTLERRLEEMVGVKGTTKSKHTTTNSANSSAILLMTALCSNDKAKLNTVLTECASNASLLRRTIAGVPPDSIDTLVRVLVEHISLGKQNALAHYTCLEMALAVHRRSMTPTSLALLAPLLDYARQRQECAEHIDRLHARLGRLVTGGSPDHQGQLHSPLDDDDEPLCVADLRTRREPTALADSSSVSVVSSDSDMEEADSDSASTTGSTSSASSLASELSSIESLSALTKAALDRDDDGDGSDDEGDDTLFKEGGHGDDDGHDEDDDGAMDVFAENGGGKQEEQMDQGDGE